MRLIYFILLFAPLLFTSCDDSLTSNIGPARWTLQREPQSLNYNSVQFTDKEIGWVIGDSGTIEKSANGGASWEKQESGVSASLWDVCFINNRQGWISGADNTILKTTNGGETWINISPSSTKNKLYLSIEFVNEHQGWTSNNNGEILKTNDGGLSWQISKENLIGGSELSIVNSETIYALCVKLYKTTNGGQSWDTISVPVPKNYMATNIFFKEENGWIVTWNGTGGTYITEFPILYTTDGGTTWSSSNFLKDGGFRCAFFMNGKNGWAAGTQNIYSTSDGGKNWHLQFTDDKHYLFSKDICFVDENCGWLLTHNGAIYKYQKRIGL